MHWRTGSPLALGLSIARRDNSSNTSASASVVEPLVATCSGYSFPNVVCMNRYGSNIPPDWSREVAAAYSTTSVPSDSSFLNLQDATFIVWDQTRGQEILGSDPTYEYMFQVDSEANEAPVYVPDTNELWISDLGTGVLTQLVVDLAASPPTISRKTTDPPLYAPAGARYRNGTIYFSAAGGNSTLEGGPYHPGIYAVDPKTLKSSVVVNNYYGYYFTTADDLDIDKEGNIWFTDPVTSRNAGLSTMAPQIQQATYRHNIQTGATNIVEDTMGFPNGISFSPDYKNLYITDTAAGVPMIDPAVSWQDAGYLKYNSTNKRTVYAFDVSDDGTYLLNRRPIYTAMDYIPDGLKVSSNGYLLTGAGHGVDILDNRGTLLLTIQTNFTAVNMDFAGENRDELWIVGDGNIARVKMNLKGTALY